jgi:hypothetical protein
MSSIETQFLNIKAHHAQYSADLLVNRLLTKARCNNPHSTDFESYLRDRIVMRSPSSV